MSTVPHARSPSPFADRPVAAAVVLAVLLVPLVVLVSISTAASPATTLLGLVAIASVVVLLFRIELALLLLIAAGSLEEAFQISANPQITITKIAGAICFASFGRYALTSRRKLQLDGSHAVVLGILLLALASTAQAFDSSAALTTTTRYASFVALYVIVSQFAGADRLHRQIAWVLTLAAAVAAFIGLRSYLAGSTVVATLPYSNPSDFAFILATTLPLTIWLLGSTRRLRPPLLVIIGLICVAVVLSLSRGTVVGLAAGLAWLVVIDRRHVRVVLGGGLLALLVAFLVIRSDPSRFETALLYKEKVADYNVTTRYDAWQAAGQLAVENPLGVGPGNFRFYYNKVTGRPEGTHNLYVAHNAYLDMAAELGIGGMILFIVYLGTTMQRLTVAARRGDGLPGYAQALRISLVIAIFSAMFVSEQYYPPFWLIGGLATALWAEGGRRKRAEAGATTSPEVLGFAPPADEYDRDVLEGREGRVKAQFHAIRVQQERLRARERAVGAREAELAHRHMTAELIEARAAEAGSLTEREAALARRLESVTARELAVTAREREQAAAPTAKPTPEPAADSPAPTGFETAKGWNLFALERLVAEHAEMYPERVDEWNASLVELRAFADEDGVLPHRLESLIATVFGDVAESDPS